MASTRGGLRSAESTDYVLPKLRTKFAERGFSYVGPAQSGCVETVEPPARASPQNVISQAAFKRQLKTFLARDSMLSALYAIANPSVRLSVCLSATRVDQSKTVEVRIMQFSPDSSPIPLVSTV